MCSVGSRLGAARSGTPVPLPPHSLEGPVLGSCLWRVLTWCSQPGPLQPAWNPRGFGGGGSCLQDDSTSLSRALNGPRLPCKARCSSG